jgi:hypothetical protein
LFGGGLADGVGLGDTVRVGLGDAVRLGLGEPVGDVGLGPVGPFMVMSSA